MCVMAISVLAEGEASGAEGSADRPYARQSGDAKGPECTASGHATIGWPRALHAARSPVADRLRGERTCWQHFLTMAGMVAVITSVLAGATAALLVALVANHSLPEGQSP